MPAEIYEIVAQGARYWFLFLMALIVWRSYRWLKKDRRQQKKRMRLLPDAGFIGEMVVVSGCGALEPGDALPVPHEGTLGFSRMNDLCVPANGVSKRQLWFCYTPEDGLMLRPGFGRMVQVDDEKSNTGRHPLFMSHGSYLTVGEARLRLRMFAGFERFGHAHGQWSDREDEPDSREAAPAAVSAQPQAPAMTPEQFVIFQQQQQLLRQQEYMRQMAYAQWMAAQAAAPGGDGEEAGEDEEAREESASPAQVYDFAPPAPSQQVEFETQGQFYPPAMDEEEEAWPYAPSPASQEFEEFLDDDRTAAAAPPKSAYVGPDEAERAKKTFWDKYLGGGERP